MKSYIKLHKQN